jgi:glycerol-3-phosphate cytidylyltransferase
METSIINLFNGNINDTYYSEVYGFSKNVNIYRNITHLYAKIFFKLLNDMNLDYYVFAGTSIGYVRNAQNIPWVDDYDIIIFEDQFTKFNDVIIPKLNELDFRCDMVDGGVGYQIFSKSKNISKLQNIFQCDIFFSTINQNGIIRNTNGWGLYDTKNIHINLVKPKKYLTIDNDLTLPFFNNIHEDVKIEYGDVLNNCVIHVNHSPICKINSHFTEVYDCFNNIKTLIINNTKKLFDEHLYINNETQNNYNNFTIQLKFETNDVLNHIAVLKYIKEKNIKTWNIMDKNFLIFCPDIKYYFKDIIINFYVLNNIDKKNLIFLNYVDNMFCSNQLYIDYIKKYMDIWCISNKPKIDSIRVITFGTFDLFHIGHVNILKRAKQYGELFVGVSTDELNLKKNKKSVNNLEHRKNDVKNSNYANYIFDEESLELKNEYVKKYNCNLLIMGDDWKNKFNYCDCACLYLRRTPNISSTFLKKKMMNAIFKKKMMNTILKKKMMKYKIINILKKYQKPKLIHFW